MAKSNDKKKVLEKLNRLIEELKSETGSKGEKKTDEKRVKPLHLEKAS